MYSHNKAARLRNLRNNPRVSLNFDSHARGEADVHVITGTPIAPESRRG